MADIGIKISATDAASGVFKSVATEAGKLQGAIGSISSSLGAFTTTAIAGLSVLSFASQIKQAIDLADSFNKLSQKTGVAVDELSKLNYAAGLADVGTDALAGGLKKLNLAISAAASGSKEQAALFQSLGISIKDAQGNALSADKVFAQLSDRFADSADGANKTAVAVALLGKNGADLVPLLNGGSQSLKDLGDEATKLGIVLGPDFARNAEAFNDNLHKMSLAGQGLSVTLGGDLVRYLSEASTEMANAAIQGGKLAGVWAGLKSLWSGPKQYQLDKAMVEQTDKLLEAENYLAKLQGSGNEIAIKLTQNRVAWLKAEVALTLEQRKALEGVNDQKAKAAAAAPTQDSAAIKAAAAALHKPATAPSISEDSFVAGRDAAKDWAKSFTEFRKLAAEASAEVDGLSKAQAHLLSYLTSNGYTNASEPMRQLALAEAYAAINAEELAKATKLSAKEALEAVNSYADSVEAQQKAADTLREQVVAEREHVAAIGLSVEAIAELVAAKYEDQAVSKDNLATLADTVDATGTMGAAYRQQAKDLRELAALKRSGALKETIVEANKKIDEENKRTAEKLESAITDGLMRGFENGKSIAENFRDTVENMFRTMVLRPVVQATVNTGLQALGIPGVGGAGGSGGGLLKNASDAYGLYDKASSLFGGSTSSAFGFAGLAGAGTAAGATAVLPAVTTAAIEAGITAGGASIYSLGTAAGAAGVSLPTFGAGLGGSFGGAAGATTLGTTVAAPLAGGAAPALGIPGIGWAIGGALLLAGLLGGGGGRSVQSTGETSLNFDESGKETSRAAYRFQGIDEATAKEYGMKYVDLNEGANNFATSLNKTYIDAAKSLGITAAASNFAYGGNDADSSTGQGKFRLGAGVVGGKSYFNSGEIAKSDEALKLAASRAVLTALSGSEMPKYLAGVFDSVGDIATNSQAQIDAVLATAQSFKALHDSLSQLPFDNLKDQTYAVYKAVTDAAGGLEKFGQSLGSYYTNFYSAEEQRAQTAKNLSRVLGDVGLALPVTRDAFRALVDAQDLTTEAGQKAYSALIGVSGAFAGITTAATDTTTALAATRKALLDAATGAASAAQTALQRSVEAQRTTATVAKDVAAQSVAELTSLMGTLQDAVLGLRGSSQPQQSISTMLQAARATGYLPSEGDLRSAISASVQDLQQRPYASAQEADFARATLAAQLSDLQGIGGSQLASAKDSLTIAQQQLDQLDSLERVAQQQLDAANGTLTAVLSIKDALSAFNTSIASLTGTRVSQSLPTTAVSAAGDFVIGGSTPGQNAAGYSAAEDTGRIGRIADYVQLFDWTSSDAATKASTLKLVSELNTTGITQDELAKATGKSRGDISAFFAAYGIPAFDVGTNYVPRDMLAQIHEGEAIIPRAYNPAAGGGSNDKLLAEVIGELRRLRAQVDVLSEHGKRTADATNGRPEAPVLVEIA